MADIELVIKIPEENYEEYKRLGDKRDILFEAIRNGTLLPKGHGDLIDRKELLEKQYRIDDSATLSTRDVVNVEDIEDTSIIIETDKGE